MKPPDDSTDMFWGKNATNLYRVPANKLIYNCGIKDHDLTPLINQAAAQKLEELLEHTEVYVKDAHTGHLGVPVSVIKQELAKLTTKDKD